MKLLELLVNQLHAWPTDARFLTQGPANATAFNKGVVLGFNMQPTLKNHNWTAHGSWTARIRVNTIAEDAATAVVTRQEWERAKGISVEPASATLEVTMADEWIRHRGYRMPVDGKLMIKARLRNGDVTESVKASSVQWKHEKNDKDVMGYCLVPVTVSRANASRASKESGLNHVSASLAAWTPSKSISTAKPTTAKSPTAKPTAAKSPTTKKTAPACNSASKPAVANAVAEKSPKPLVQMVDGKPMKRRDIVEEVFNIQAVIELNQIRLKNLLGMLVDAHH